MPVAMPRMMPIDAPSGRERSSFIPASASWVSSASHDARRPLRGRGLSPSPAMARASTSLAQTQRMPRL